MNVLVISMRGPTNENRRGGAQDYIRYIFGPWVEQGDEVRILCMQEQTADGFLPHREDVDGIEVVRANGGSYINRLIGVMRRAYASQEWADLLVENIMTIPLFTPLWKKKDLSFLAVKHHLQGRTFLTGKPWYKSAAGLLSERIGFPLLYREVPLIVNSPHTKKNVEKLWLGGWREIHVVPPGIKQFPVKAKKSERPTILYLGSLHLARKRVDDLLKAFRRVHRACPEAQLIIAGEGPDKERLQEQASDLPVTFPGFVSEKEKHRLFEKAWIFASPSTKEGFGITWVEANSHGTPVVGYDLGLETVTPSCSIMVNKNDVKGMSEGIIRLIENPSRRKEMEKAAKENANRFDWKYSSRRFRELSLREARDL